MIIGKNQTRVLAKKPLDRKTISVNWYFKTKLKVNGSINKNKERLVVKGYTEIFGVDHSETFAPVDPLDTIKLVLAIVAKNGRRVYQLDVKSSFLNGILQEEIYVERPDGYVVKGQENRVCLLKKYLYSLKNE